MENPGGVNDMIRYVDVLIEEETLFIKLNTNMKTNASLSFDRMYKEIGMLNKNNTRSIVIEACEIALGNRINHMQLWEIACRG